MKALFYMQMTAMNSQSGAAAAMLDIRLSLAYCPLFNGVSGRA
jgi:hypothetical protein